MLSRHLLMKMRMFLLFQKQQRWLLSHWQDSYDLHFKCWTKWLGLSLLRVPQNGEKCHWMVSFSVLNISNVAILFYSISGCFHALSRLLMKMRMKTETTAKMAAAQKWHRWLVIIFISRAGTKWVPVSSTSHRMVINVTKRVFFLQNFKCCPLF